MRIRQRAAAPITAFAGLVARAAPFKGVGRDIGRGVRTTVRRAGRRIGRGRGVETGLAPCVARLGLRGRIHGCVVVRRRGGGGPVPIVGLVAQDRVARRAARTEHGSNQERSEPRSHQDPWTSIVSSARAGGATSAAALSAMNGATALVDFRKEVIESNGRYVSIGERVKTASRGAAVTKMDGIGRTASSDRLLGDAEAQRRRTRARDLMAIVAICAPACPSQSTPAIRPANGYGEVGRLVDFFPCSPRVLDAERL